MKFGLWIFPPVSRLWSLVPSLFCISAFAATNPATVDTSKLPPPSTRPVTFAADIKPIFETSCLRCHGAERPKSRFSLITRESALRGGENGIDILPGDSARSPLIYYVAGLVPDMEMPPSGKAPSLTREQIALLRAWIDQGAAWDDTAAAAQYTVQYSFAPALRWVTVSGNAQRFQEHQWIRRGVSGGLNDFWLSQKLTNGVTVVASGHALTDDYKVTLDIRKPDVGFARFGMEQFRRYYDDRGPSFPFRASGFATQVQPLFDLDRDLHLDVGKAFAEFGLTLPHWPQVTIGYEYQYKDGDKSTEQWGPVTQLASGTNLVRNIFPAYKSIQEDVHVVRMDVTHEIAGVSLEDNLRAEFSSLRTRRANDFSFSAGNVYPEAFVRTRERQDQFQFANTLQAGKSVTDWFYISGGYLYSRVDAGADFRQDTADGADRQAPGLFWLGRDIVLKGSDHVFNLNGQGGPWAGLTASVGLQAALSEKTGFGGIDLREGEPNDPSLRLELEPEPAFVRSDTDRSAIQETVVLRYTSIPATTLFADARLKQERIGEFEEQSGGEHDFLRDTVADDDWQEYKAGFDMSPWRYVSFHGAYTRRMFDSDYDHHRDEQPHDAFGQGYPAFLRSRESETDMAEARLVFRPASWIKASLRYAWAKTDYRTTTDPVDTIAFDTLGGGIFAGNHDSSTYSASVTLLPLQRLSLSTTVSYVDSKIVTKDNGSTAVAPYKGDTWSMLLAAAYSLDTRTDLTATYSFSRGRYGQHNTAGGLPLGIDYDLHGLQAGVKRRISDKVTAALQYGFFDYTEPTAQGLNDYTAHMAFATLSIDLP